MRRCEEGATPGHARGSKASKKPDDPLAPPKDATTLACNEEYENNKAAIDGGGQSRAKFVKDCKNGTETVPGGVVSPPPAADAPAEAPPKPASPGESKQAAPAPATSAPTAGKKP